MSKQRMLCVFTMELDDLAAAAYTPKDMTVEKAQAILQRLNMASAEVQFFDVTQCPDPDKGQTKKEAAAQAIQLGEIVDFGMLLRHANSVTEQYLKHVAAGNKAAGPKIQLLN